MSAQLVRTVAKRQTFIGTPYWLVWSSLRSFLCLYCSFSAHLISAMYNIQTHAKLPDNVQVCSVTFDALVRPSLLFQQRSISTSTRSRHYQLVFSTTHCIIKVHISTGTCMVLSVLVFLYHKSHPVHYCFKCPLGKIHYLSTVYYWSKI